MPITIPSRSVEPSGIPNSGTPNIGPGAFQSFQKTGQAATQYLSDYYEKEKKKLDQAVLLDADLKLSDLTTKIDLEIANNYQGSKAPGALDYAKQEYQKGSADIDNSLSNDEQKMSFQHRSVSHWSDLNRRTQTHVFNQTEEFSKKTKDSSLVNRVLSSERNYQDPATIQKNLGEGSAIIGDYNRTRGVPDEQTQAEISKFKIDTYASAEKGLMDRFLYLYGNWQDNKGEMASFMHQVNETKDGKYVNYPWLDSDKRKTIHSDIRALEGLMKADAKEAKALHQEATEKGFVDLELRGMLTETAVANSGLDADKQRLYIDRLRNQRERWAAADNKEGVFKTDKMVNAQLYSRIVQDPGNVPETEILDHIGKDISQEDGKQLIDELNKRLKPEKDPVAIAGDGAILANLERDRKDGIFGSGQGGDAEYLKQIEAYKKWRDIHPNDDASEYYNKLIEPYKATAVEKMLDWLPKYDPRLIRPEKRREEISGANIPKGAVRVGKTKDGKDAYKLQDGSYWTP